MRRATFVPLNPIPLKERTAMSFHQYDQIDVMDGAVGMIDKTGISTHMTVGSVDCSMPEPVTPFSYAAELLSAPW